MQQFRVHKSEAESFAKVWRSKGGLVGALDDLAILFATDFANVVLRNFIEMCQQQVMQARQTPEEPKKKLIVEA